MGVDISKLRRMRHEIVVPYQAHECTGCRVVLPAYDPCVFQILQGIGEIAGQSFKPFCITCGSKQSVERDAAIRNHREAQSRAQTHER
jgi:hypothetical protein